MSPKAVVLDFGGVLVEIHGRQVMNALKALVPGTQGAAWDGIASWKAHHDYERGLMSTDQFRDEVSTRVGHPLAPADFLGAWNQIFGPVVTGIEAVLVEIAAARPLYLLSNTNAAHWDHISVAYPFMRHFKHRFTSFELGERKPDRAIYEALAAKLALPPRDLLFIDDLPANVEGAKAAGLAADVCLNSAERLREIMVAHGVLARPA